MSFNYHKLCELLSKPKVSQTKQPNLPNIPNMAFIYTQQQWIAQKTPKYISRTQTYYYKWLNIFLEGYIYVDIGAGILDALAGLACYVGCSMV